MATDQRLTHRFIPNRRLPPGIDDGVHSHAPHTGPNHQKTCARELKRDRDEVGLRMSAARVCDGDQIMPEVDVESLVGKPFRTQDTVGAP